MKPVSNNIDVHTTLMFVIIVDELTKANSKQLRCLAINK